MAPCSPSWSVSASVAWPCRAAAAAISTGCDAPSRNEKHEWRWSSTYGMRTYVPTPYKVHVRQCARLKRAARRAEKIHGRRRGPCAHPMRALRTRASLALRSPARVALAAFLLALPALVLLKAHSHAARFPLARAQAIRVASADERARHFLDREPYTRVRISPVDRELERVTFLRGYHLVADVAIDRRGRVTHVAGQEAGAPATGSTVANFAPVLVLLALLFALVTATVPLVSLRNLDVLAMASLTVPVWLLNRTLVEPSVWAAYPPLIYLAARCMGMGLGQRRAREPAVSLYWHVTSRWPADQRRRVLRMLVAALATFTAIVVPTSTGASDVAFAAMSGATDLIHGVVPYGHIPAFIVHGDTYPLLTYVAYVPAAVLMPVRDVWDDPTGGLLITTAATLLAAGGLYRIGVRMARAGGSAQAGPADGEPPSVAGMRTMLAFLAFPPVVLAASGGANDAVLAACVVGAFACFHHTRRSTVMLGVAAWVKIVPALALPVWLARMPRRRALHAAGLLALMSGALAAVLVALGGPGALPAMLRAIAFQLERSSLHSLWVGLGLGGLQPVASAVLVGAVAAATIAVRRDATLGDDLCRMAALVAGIELIAQIAGNYWTWAYMPWVAVPVLLSLLAPASAPARSARSAPAAD